MVTPLDWKSICLQPPTLHWYNLSLFRTSELVNLLYKGNRAIADLRYGKEDSISPSTLIFAATKG